MKKILYIPAFAAICLAAAVSCSKNSGWDETLPDIQEGITLRFSSSALATKGTVPGENRENYVGSLQFFIFPVNAEGVVDDDTEYKMTATYTEGGTGWTYSAGTDATEDEPAQKEKWTYTLTKAQIADLFPAGTKQVKVFAVANYVDQYGANNDMESYNTTFPEDAKTWKDIHELEVGPTFFYDDKDPDFLLRWPHVLNPEDEDLFFVMTGTADLLLSQPETKVDLERLASKVTVSFTYESVLEEKDSGNILWIPQEEAGETRVYLSNAIEHTTLGGPLAGGYVADSWDTATKPLGDGTRDIFEYAYNFMNEITAVDEDGNKMAHFYTYPIDVEEGDDNQPYLKLVLPWYGYKYYGEGEMPAEYDATDPAWRLYKQMEVYYKIALPRETIKDPNCIYEYKVNVNIIGSDKEVLIQGEYQVKNWTTSDPISSNVATGRYISLDIPKDEYDMYTDEIDINFVSSGTVVAQIDEIYQLNYSNATGATRDYFMQNNVVTASQALRTAKGVTVADIQGWVTIPAETSHLTISHAMDNRMTVNNAKNTAFDMAPYVYVVTLHLVEAGQDTSFDRTVTITQYPALFVTSRVSNGYTFVNNYGNASGSVVCYDDRGTSSNNYRLGNISNRAGSLDGTENNNVNPNNYIITTSMLSKELQVQIGDGTAATKEATILGDPRKSEVDNLSNLGLTNYHPTNPDGTRATIAPKLLIASSYGVVGGNYFFNQATAQKRCAAYQENGYPAGRWRVPTLAEITFMMTLSNMGFIPSLYNLGRNDGEGYWCANGKVSGDANALPYLSNNTDNTAVRCVYDAWYWGEEPYQENATTWLGFLDK